MTCAFVTPAGSCVEIDALEDDVRRLAEDLRAEHAEHDADDAEQDDADDHAALGRRRPSRRLADGPKFIAFSAGMPMPPNGPPPPGAAAHGRRAVRARARRRLRGVVGGAHAASSDRELALHDLGVLRRGLAAVRHGCRCRRPRRRRARRSGRRRGWCDTRCATTMHGRAAHLAVERGAQPRVGRRVERRERVVEDVDLRPLHQGSRDRQPLSLTARDVRAALRDRRVELLGHRLDEVLAPGRSRARARARRRWRRACRSAGCVATVPENRYGRCGTSPMRAHSSVGVELAHVDAVDQHGAAGHVEQARQQVDQGGLAGAGAADDRGRRARARR